MSRITKLVAAAALLAVPLIQACGEDPIPPPATGTITGKVAIEGDGADGVTVTLSSGVTATTANGGGFTFADVEEGTYTVTISNYPEDASFAQTSAPATLSEDGETVTVNFNGSYIRTSAIMGTVMVEDEGLSNVTVKITGMSESETLTGATGQYAFTGLRAGNYTIEISGFDTDDIAFGATSSTAQVSVGESKVVSFDGTYLRASGVSGQVSVEGVGLAGVTVSLQGRGEDFTERTNAAGQFMFDKLRKGEYAVAISGYDDDEYGFDVTSKTVTVARGETGSVPFEGIALRTAGIKGTVSVAGHGPLDGVTVSLSGKGEDMSVVTNAAGQWSFDRLHAGDYSVAITGYDRDDFGFDVTSENVTVALKETATVEFEGILLRTAAIEGEVTVKGDALPGVTVTVSGGPKNEEFEAKTNTAGMYEVDGLHAGDYSVTISGYDTDEYGFEVTTKSVSVGLRQTAEVAFDGILLRTAGVSGRVTIDGEPMSGLTVKLGGEEDRSDMTDSNGQYAFSGLAAGDYTLTLSGYDTDEYKFDPSMMDIELELDEAAIHNFMGRSLRTVAVMGTVSAEGDALMNVGVTLIKVLGATTGQVLGATMTDEDGGYMFDELLAGVYRIELGETDDEYDFATKSRQGSVATDDTATWNFDADIIRTASVGGEVTVDGEGMGGVMVMLTGDHDTDEEMETGSDGMYMFDGLRKGSYTVTIENPDDDTYDFPTTSRSVSLSVAQEQDDVSFAGSMLRRASISGQVYVVDPDMSLEGVTVTLDGDAEDEVMTDANGEYNFPGLAGGDYEVEIENPDEDAYVFDMTEIEVKDLGDEEAKIVDFAGEHTTTASISGMMFLDEVMNDSAHTEGEPAFEAKIPLLLQAPDQSVILGAADSTGMYTFAGLKAGRYRVAVAQSDTLTRMLAIAGYRFTGPTLGVVVDVPAATEMNVNFPFRITKQTIQAGAVLATTKQVSYPINGVRMVLYPTVEDAADGTNSLGTATTRTIAKVPGVATFDFDRADDKGPGGGDIDYLVYALVVSTPTGIVAHDDRVIEIEYEAVDRVSHAPTAAKLINTRVNFQWWVKSNETAKDGNRFLGGWVAKNGTTVLDTTNADGRGRYTGAVSASQMAAMISGAPARFSVALGDTQADSVDMNELWTQSRSLTHVHTGLEHPDSNRFDNNDLGPIYVTWHTHAIVLGVYRETDDVEGFTNYQSRVPGGDHRPASSVQREMMLEFLADDDRGRLKPYKYNHDRCTNKRNHHKTEDREVSVSFRNGLARVSCLPRNDEFTVRFTVDTASAPNRVEVGIVAEKLRGYIEPYNKRDMTVGGSTVGAFGDGSGGVPEVRVCLSSAGTKDDECATWGYQWKTGSVIGAVKDTRRNRVSGHRIFIEPVTDGHGADTTSTRSSSARDYELDRLQDGVYEITAYSTRTHRIRGDSVHEVVVYHDETDDNDDEDLKYYGIAAQDTADWSVQKLGLKLMGYIGHDENRDSKFRGAEAVAGISVRLSGGGLSKSTATDERGFYKFEDLPEGSYRITPSTSSYLVVRGYRTNSVTGTKTAETSWSASAQTYPSSIEEGDVRLPRWNSYTSRSLSNPSHRVCDDRDPPTCGTFYNFGLLYMDGEIEGTVNNLSGSSYDIDLRWVDRFTNDTSEITISNPRGTFGHTRLTEGDFTVSLEDLGWGIPRLNSRGEPDDDGTTPGPSTVTARLRGEDDFETMPTLHVYDESASSDDNARSASVRANIHGTTSQNFDSAVTWRSFWTRRTGTEETSATTNLGTISWKSESVRLTFRRATGATYELKNGSTECSGTTCELRYNATGSRDSLEVRENTLNLTVTAPNGYDDHEYSLIVGRAAPVGRHLASSDVIALKSDGTDSTATASGGEGTKINTAWTLETKSSSSSSATVRFDLETLGDPDEDNAYCPQSIVVQEYNDTDTVKAMTASDDDICTNARYRLSATSDGTLYEVEVSSEDGVKEVYYLEVLRAPPAKSDDASLKSLALKDDDENPVNLNESFRRNVLEYTADVDHDVDELEVSWETSNEDATTDRDPSPYTLDLEAAGEDTELTITVTPENGEEDDEITYTLTVTRAPVPSGEADLSSLAMEDLDDNPLPLDQEEFDPDVLEYTAEVAPSVDKVDVEWETASDAATTAPESPHRLTLDDQGESETLTITVTAEDETTKEYTLEVERAEETDDAKLKSLTLKESGEGGKAVALNETFDPATLAYTAGVDNDVEEVDVAWVTSDKWATTNHKSPYTFELDDEGESETLTITVTASDEETEKTYTLTVTRGAPGDDATLKTLEMKGLEDGEELTHPETLAPAFDPDADPPVFKYTATVDDDIAQVKVYWTTADGATTTDEGGDAISTGHTFDLNDAGGDPKDLVIIVIPENGEEDDKNTYTIKVTREAPGTDARLATLTLAKKDGKPVNLNEEWNPEAKPLVDEYTATVRASVSELNVEWTTMDDDATVATDPDADPLVLDVAGETTDLTITVTADDGTTTQVYTLTVTRLEASDDADLKSLTMKDGDGNALPLNEQFAKTTTRYTAYVHEDIEEVKVVWETNDDEAETRPTEPDDDNPYSFDLDDEVGEPETLDITVTAEDDETTKRYTLTVTRQEPSADADLKTLTLPSGMTLTPPLDETETEYATETTSHSVNKVDLSWTTHSQAKTSPGSPYAFTGLVTGKNELDIVVTPGTGNDEDKKEYKLEVWRPGILLTKDDASISTIEVDEGSTGNTYMVGLATRLAADDAAVVVELTLPEGNTDITFTSSSTLTFSPPSGGGIPDALPVTFSTSEDDDTETEVVQITHTATDAGANQYDGATTTLAVTILDKNVVVSPTGKEIRAGKSGTYTVVLTSPPTGNVIVEISEAPANVSVPSQVDFTPSNWDVEQTVTIDASNAGDYPDENDVIFTLTHDASGGGYGEVAAANLDAVVKDTSVAQVVITTTALTVDEGGSFSYDIVLTKAPASGEKVTVDLVYTSTHFDAIPDSKTFTSSDWDVPFEITVTAKNVAAGVATRTIRHSVSVEDKTDDDTQPVYSASTTASDVSVRVRDVPE